MGIDRLTHELNEQKFNKKDAKKTVEAAGKKWSPAEARQVFETKLELLKKAKDSKEALSFKKNILFDIKNQLKKCAEADITQRKEILDHIEYLEDLAGADIEDIYKEIGPKNKKQIDKIKSFVEEEESDKKKREDLSTQIKQDRTWTHMKGTTIKAQKAEAADYGPASKTKEAAIARQVESAGALASADVYEEHLKKSTGGWLSRVYDRAKGLLTTKKFEKDEVKIIEDEARENMDSAFEAVFTTKFKKFNKDVQNQMWPHLKEAAVGEVWKTIKSGDLKWNEGDAQNKLQDKFSEILSSSRYMEFAKSLSAAQGEWGREAGKAKAKSAERSAQTPKMSVEEMAASFGGKITAEKPLDTVIPSDEAMAASIGKKVAVEKSAPQPVSTRVKEFFNPPTHNVRVEVAGGEMMSREELKKNEKLVRAISDKVEDAFNTQHQKFLDSGTLSGAELKYFIQNFVEKGKLAEETTSALVDKEANIDNFTIENKVQSVLNKALKEYIAEQKGEQKFAAREQVKAGREVVAEEAEEALPGDEEYYEAAHAESLLGKMSKEKASRIQKVLLEDAFKDIDHNKYFTENFDKALAKLNITDSKEVKTLKGEILKVLGKEALSTLKMNEIRAEQIKTKLNTVLKKYDEGKMEGKLMELLKSA